MTTLIVNKGTAKDINLLIDIAKKIGIDLQQAKTPKVSKNQPNTLTLKTMKETEEGINLTKTISHKDLMEQLFT
jgi:hypothetical protein